MNVLQLIEASSARLTEAGVCFGQGTANAFDDAAWLVLWRLGHALHTLDDVAALPVDATGTAAVQALIGQRIATRQPSAYLTGEAWLQGVPFTVDARCIIPRSLIAEPLADGAIDVWLSEQTRSVLDLCTGNGSLAVLAAMAWPEVLVDAADCSADALAVAHLNIQRHGFAERITLHQGDGLAAVAGKAYDLILCNPPYVNSASMQRLPAEFQAEPALALAGGADGMDFIGQLLRHAAAHLKAQGVLVLEIGHEQANFDAAFPTLVPVWLPTSAGDDKVLLLHQAQLTGLTAPTP